jgi:hypothetical protein
MHAGAASPHLHFFDHRQTQMIAALKRIEAGRRAEDGRSAKRDSKVLRILTEASTKNLGAVFQPDD